MTSNSRALFRAFSEMTLSACLAVGTLSATLLVPSLGWSQTETSTNSDTDEEPATTGSDESSGQRDLSLGRFTKPLLFSPKDNGLSVDAPQFRWEVLKDNQIDIDGQKLDGRSIEFTVDRQRRVPDVNLLGIDPNAPPHIINISFRWPEHLSEEGDVTLESLDGRKLWTRTVDNTEHVLWDRSLESAPSSIQKIHGKNTWGILDAKDPQLMTAMKSGKLRACLNRTTSGLEKLRICTRPFAIVASGIKLSAKPIEEKASTETEVILDGRTIGPQGIINFVPGRKILLRFNFANQSFVEIASQPADMGMVDAVLSDDGKEVVITGHGTKPLGRARMIKTPETHFWAPTGIPLEHVWQVAVSTESPLLRVPGAFNIPFTMLIRYEDLPRESERAFTEESRSSGTYSDRAMVRGYIPSGARITSREWVLRKSDSRHFDWIFAAPKKGEENLAKVRMQSKDKKRTWVAHQEVFRGYPFEASGRLTGVLGSNGVFLLLGELSGQGWFENLPYFEGERWQHQRFGVASRYFRILNYVEYAPGKVLDTFAVHNVDVKYNLMPGIWGRDELVGIGVSAQKIDLAHLSANVLGVGAYWGRTMPKVFDDLFNFVPLMRYPKFVDVEFYYYPFSFTGGITSNATFSLNFHGRVFWTERIFGEAGFGIKNYGLVETARSSPASLSATYGTAGMGIVF